MNIWSFAYPNVEVKLENIESLSVAANESNEHLNFSNDFQDKIKSDIASSDHNDEYFNQSDVEKSIADDQKSAVRKKSKKVKLKAATMKFKCDICGSRYIEFKFFIENAFR